MCRSILLWILSVLSCLTASCSKESKNAASPQAFRLFQGQWKILTEEEFSGEFRYESSFDGVIRLVGDNGVPGDFLAGFITAKIAWNSSESLYELQVERKTKQDAMNFVFKLPKSHFSFDNSLLDLPASVSFQPARLLANITTVEEQTQVLIETRSCYYDCGGSDRCQGTQQFRVQTKKSETRMMMRLLGGDGTVYGRAGLKPAAAGITKTDLGPVSACLRH